MAGKNEQCWAGCGVTTLAARMIDTVQKKGKDWKKARRNITEKFSENNHKNSGILKNTCRKREG
ncbi:MAG: hypothetical protein ACJ701_08660 [Nitrososphaera sp.]